MCGLYSIKVVNGWSVAAPVDGGSKDCYVGIEFYSIPKYHAGKPEKGMILVNVEEETWAWVDIDHANKIDSDSSQTLTSCDWQLIERALNAYSSVL